ncbi:MAG: hypothetical protein EOM65_13975 [Synergistales bacterium]|nr:hypothetical protein [Synergistales bacterium]
MRDRLSRFAEHMVRRESFPPIRRFIEPDASRISSILGGIFCITAAARSSRGSTLSRPVPPLKRMPTE